MIRSEVRELLGDLIVESTELVEQRGDPERWLRLAAAAGRADRDTDLTDLLATLDATIDNATLVELSQHCERFANSVAWERACVYRSGLEGAYALLGPRDALNTARLELAMLRFGPKHFAPMTVPDGTPPEHWWWFEAQPASERSLAINERMRELLTIPTVGGVGGEGPETVPLGFRRLVARGFEVLHDSVFLRAITPEHELHGVPWVIYERGRSLVRAEDFLDHDPSRRPVDLAGEMLACVRYLAYELRRQRLPRCWITVEQRRLAATIRLMRRRTEEPADVYGELPMLAMIAP